MPPTNITGNAAAGEAPSPDPDAGTAPISTVPVSGDPVTAASVRQALGNPLDHIAFLKKPFGNVAVQAQPVLPMQNARLLLRGGFDHRGFPGGNLMRWYEDWIDVGFVTKNAQVGTGTWAKRWSYTQNELFSTAPFPVIDVPPISVAADFSPWLRLSEPGAPGSAVVEQCNALCVQSAGIDLVMEFVLLFPAATSTMSVAAGIFDGTLVALESAAAFETINPKGVGFHFPVGGSGGNIRFYNNTTGTPGASVDTGVPIAANTSYRCRIEIQSSNTADNSANRILAYINGTPVADLAIFPIVAWTPAFFLHGSGSGGSMKVGAVRGAHTLASGNVFI